MADKDPKDRLEEHSQIEDGFRVAFGADSGSVLDALESKTGVRSRVNLRDAPEDASPILRISPDGGATDDSRYQIVGEIARGGVGVVYKGRDKDLGRDVALKVLRTEYAQEDPVIQRFIEEAQVGGQLQHPGIVPIYGLGLQAEGQPYFAMKLVKGETLTALIEQGTAASALLGTFEQVAQTIAYAHSRGVIHRDLKPSNVMVGAFGEVQVVDWGFAKVLGREDSVVQPGETTVATVRTGAEGSQSVAGSVMGTPAYMPPEQAMGQVDELTPRADVFSLGAILCEILTGQPPYTGTMQDQLLAAAQTRLDEAHARIDAGNAPEAVKQLARDCMAPLPKDRPADAGVVASRLQDHLASVEERARQAELEAVHAAAETRKAQRGRRTTIALATVILLAVVGGGLGYAVWAGAERDRVESANRKVTPLLREATRLEGLEQWDEAASTAANALALAQSGADADTLATAQTLHDRIGKEADAANARAVQLEREVKLLRNLDELAIESIDLEKDEKEARYVAVFHAFGLDAESESAADELAGFHEPVALAVHLDGWIAARHDAKAERSKLRRLARALDKDAWRNQLRDTLETDDRDARRKTLRALAAAEELRDQQPSTFVLLASGLRGLGENEQAADVLRRAQALHPSDFWVLYWLAVTLNWGLEREAEAKSIAKATVALRPDSAAAWNLLGAVYPKGHPTAIRLFKKALELNPKLLASWSNLGLTYDEANRPDEALAACRNALRLDPNNSTALCLTADSLRKKGDLDAALAAARTAVQRIPNDSHSHSTLGNVLLARGDFEGAIKSFRESIRIKPDKKWVYVDLAETYWAKGDVESSVATYRKVLEIAPGYATAKANLGSILARGMNRYDEAEALLREAIRGETTGADPWTELAELLKKTGRLDEAEAIYRKKIQTQPTPEALARYGGFLVDYRKRYADAIPLFRKALRVKPKYFYAQRCIGIAQQLKGDRVVAAEEFKKALAIDPTHLDTRRRRGVCLFQLRRFDEAAAEFRELTRRDPKNANAHRNLGSSLAYAGKLDGAIVAWREAIRLGLRDPAIYGDLGYMLAGRGEFEEAVGYLRDAIRLAPKAPRPYYLLGDTLFKMGDFRGALDAFGRMTELVPNDADANNRLAEAKRLVDLQTRIPEVLAGKDQPENAQDWLALAQVAFQTKQHATSARFYKEAFGREPKLAADFRSGGRYNAACAAALAGQHAQARTWLREDVDLMKTLPRTARRAIRERARHALRDPDLKSIRDDSALWNEIRELAR
ncbi:MAG: serine/threonine-protein kinase [Planctomycetota bacterium]|jgi:serine/threonine-protein kinase